MLNLTLALLLQSTLIGPPDNLLKIKKPDPEAKACEETRTDEIVVCAEATQGEIVTNQRMGPIQPPTENPLTRSENGLMRLRLGKDAVVDGGGPKGSAGVGLRIRF